jgi:hypothetical protein
MGGFEGWSFSEMRVTGSTLTQDDERETAVLLGGSASAAEREDGTAAYGTLGLVFRPRRPEPEEGAADDAETNELYARAFAVRHGERLVPLAYWDKRLHRAFPAPREGTVALVGYGGGFLSFDDAAEGESTLETLYVPYARDSSGVPQKCHTIILDPDQKSIGIIQGDGRAIILGPDGIVMRANGSTWLELKDGELTVSAASIKLRGSVMIGSGLGAVPMVTGLEPCPSLFLSP